MELPLTDLLEYPWLEATWQTLLRSDDTHHCLLLSGRAGIGKTALAVELAQHLLCEDPSGQSSCQCCPSCHLVSSSLHPDLHVLIPQALVEHSHPILQVHAQRYLESHQSTQKRKPSRQISVDSTRMLSESLLTTVVTSGRKVALIIGADGMNHNAANAMLKVLEEPTPGTRFILVSSYPYRLPATIHSRCIRLDSPTPSQESAARWIESRHDIDPDELGLLLRSGLGPLELDQIIGDKSAASICQLIRYFTASDTKAADSLSLAALCAKIGAGRALSILQSVALAVIRESVEGHSRSKSVSDGVFGNRKLAIAAFRQLGLARERFNGPVDEQLSLEDICSRLCAPRL